MIDTRRNDQGFALVLVLWALLLLTALGAGLLVEARVSRTVAATSSVRLKAQLIADGAINRVVMAVLDPRDPLHLSLDGAGQAVNFLDHGVELATESETGKINLNTAAPPLLAELFRGIGVAPDDATALAARIVAWRVAPSESDRADIVGQYDEAGRTYAPRFGLFRTVGELRLVLGMTNALQSAVAPLVTVWSESADIDRSVARADVLQVLRAAGDDQAESQLEARKKGQAVGIDRPVKKGEVVTITARLAMDGLAVSRVAVIQIAGDPHEPYRVLAWN